MFGALSAHKTQKTIVKPTIFIFQSTSAFLRCAKILSLTSRQKTIKSFQRSQFRKVEIIESISLWTESLRLAPGLDSTSLSAQPKADWTYQKITVSITKSGQATITTTQSRSSPVFSSPLFLPGFGIRYCYIYCCMMVLI